MPIDVQPFLQWAAPILSTIIVTITTASINAKIASGEKKRDEARSERDEERKRVEEWRKRVEEQLRTHGEFIAERDDWFEWRKRIEDEFSAQNNKTDVILELQCSQIRSDLVHRAHRYIDDLGCASTEEKNAFWAQYEDYQRVCAANGIENHFIDGLAKQVMNLPTREMRAENNDD